MEFKRQYILYRGDGGRRQTRELGNYKQLLQTQTQNET